MSNIKIYLIPFFYEYHIINVIMFENVLKFSTRTCPQSERFIFIKQLQLIRKNKNKKM